MLLPIPRSGWIMAILIFDRLCASIVLSTSASRKRARKRKEGPSELRARVFRLADDREDEN